MNMIRSLPVLCGLSACLALLPTIVQADEWDKKTVVTISAPMEIPGVHLAGWGILPAGTYVFKLLSSQSNRHIVQIFSQDEKTVYATILAIPNYRLRVTDKTVITFHERPAGQPEALRAWFYPGRNYGEEFVYPKSKAMDLAKQTQNPILYTPAPLPLEVDKEDALAAPPLVAQLQQAPLAAISPKGEEVQLAAVVSAPPANEESNAREPLAAAQEPITQERAQTLPATAGNLQSLGILGLAALAVGILIRKSFKGSTE